MAVATMVTNNQLSGHTLIGHALCQANVTSADNACDMLLRHRSSYRPTACIDGSPIPSVGIVTARGTEHWVMPTSSCALLPPDDCCTREVPVESRCSSAGTGRWGRSSRGDRSVGYQGREHDGIIQDEVAGEFGSELKNENCAAVDKDCAHCSQLVWTR
jgi:hypothetical protein